VIGDPFFTVTLPLVMAIFVAAWLHNKHFDALTGMINSMQGQINALQGQIDVLRSSLEGQISALQGQINALNARLEALDRRIDKSRAEILAVLYDIQAKL